MSRVEHFGQSCDQQESDCTTNFVRMRPAADGKPHIVGIGGTLLAQSSTETALRIALAGAHRRGATTSLIAGLDLDLPMYVPGCVHRAPKAVHLVNELRKATGVILASPGYHGGVSGLVKNALDYVEDLSGDPVPYLDRRAVGCIATAGGGQAAVSTLNALRSFAHAVRAWPTPLGVTIIAAQPVFTADGQCVSDKLAQQLDLLAEQVFIFASAIPHRDASRREPH